MTTELATVSATHSDTAGNGLNSDTHRTNTSKHPFQLRIVIKQQPRCRIHNNTRNCLIQPLRQVLAIIADPLLHIIHRCPHATSVKESFALTAPPALHFRISLLNRKSTSDTPIHLSPRRMQDLKTAITDRLPLFDSTSTQRTHILARATLLPLLSLLGIQLGHRGHLSLARREQLLPARLERLHVLLVDLLQLLPRVIVRVKRLGDDAPLLPLREGGNRDLFGGDDDAVQLEERERKHVDGGCDGVERITQAWRARPAGLQIAGEVLALDFVCWSGEWERVTDVDGAFRRTHLGPSDGVCVKHCLERVAVIAQLPERTRFLRMSGEKQTHLWRVAGDSVAAVATFPATGTCVCRCDVTPLQTAITLPPHLLSLVVGVFVDQLLLRRTEIFKEGSKRNSHLSDLATPLTLVEEQTVGKDEPYLQ